MNKSVINFVSINNHSLLPVTRFIIEDLSRNYDINIIESRIEGNYEFIGIAKIKKLISFKSRNDFLKQGNRIKTWKYVKLIFRLLDILISRKNQIIYTPDLQVIVVFSTLNKIIDNRKIKLIYHQFELIEEKYIGSIELHAWKRVLKNIKFIDLFICPEINRLKYFIQQSKIQSDLCLLFPNSLRANSKNNCGSADSKSFKTDFLPDNAFVIAHVGSVGPDHYLDNFIKIINAITIEYVYVIMVGRIDDQVQLLLKEITFPRFVQIDEIPHKDLGVFYKRIDMGFILYKGINYNFEFCAPNKLYEYWSNGIFVIAHPLKGLQEIVFDEKMGLLINLNDINNVVRNVNILILNQLIEKGLIKEKFNIKYSLDGYLSILNHKIKDLLHV